MTDGVAAELRDTIDFARDKRGFDELALHRMLGLTLEELRVGYARICLHSGGETAHGIGGGVHGGVLAAMVDIVMLRAIMTSLQKNDVPAGTASLGLDYLKPAVGAKVFAEATVVRKGRTLSYVEVSFTDEAGTLFARGRSTYVTRQTGG